ncbi:MAG: tRNA (adenosine(37)-N6)-threonylcarbamoyltransferase complex dimerization subunit type 1 TsaB [Ruminococcaceae bacterium]|nr:tRNA (adenosine(37)-N6)-threonylcarbamoyltransferase complex dimerization subunit type 1 TsaB [Oscillospiraceae bacterium]
MKILAFDSTARAASVAVCEDERLLGLYTIDNGLTQSELLLPMAENLLKSLKLTFDDIGLLCAAVGPGSFTGVRIGVSLVKGIAFGKNIPCVSVSTLDALAENTTPLAGILVPCMDAKRGQVYTAIYKSDGASAKKMTEDMAISIEELADMLKDYSGQNIYICGDGYNVAKSALEKLGIKTANTPTLLITENAYSCAVSALKKYRNNEYLTDTEMSPTYLRLPQAERERLEREKQFKMQGEAK